ncbi:MULTISPECIES: Bug family tripartite tricarboxylate transporter substrate binding protein [Achromobacter]|uniref:Bug family tripartite tricarboxylate transporter substrate binding protein n=1 Tax=Achromobacter TaxID=222 RepID=UPI00257EAD66|nr:MULTISPECIES: tripartite tricarboxylate transporter substrate-binding protein [Achromobacter]
MTIRPLSSAALLGALVLGGTSAAHAQAYPAHPIKLIVGYAPAGSVDTFARIIAPELGRELGQTIVIENVAGAGGIIGVTRAVNAKPDGYAALIQGATPEELRTIFPGMWKLQRTALVSRNPSSSTAPNAFIAACRSLHKKHPHTGLARLIGDQLQLQSIPLDPDEGRRPVAS